MAGVAFSPDGTIAYATDSKSGTVAVIDVDRGTVPSTIPVGRYPRGVVFSPDGTTAYVVANEVTGFEQLTAETGTQLRGAIATIDVETQTVTDATVLEQVPRALAITPDGQTLVGLTFGSDSESLSILDVAGGSPTVVPLPGGARSFALSSDGSRAFVLSPTGHTISAVALQSGTISDTIDVPRSDFGISVDPRNGDVIVADDDVYPTRLAAYDPASWTRLYDFEAPNATGNVAFAGDGSVAYIGGDSVSDGILIAHRAEGAPWRLIGGIVFAVSALALIALAVLLVVRPASVRRTPGPGPAASVLGDFDTALPTARRRKGAILFFTIFRLVVLGFFAGIALTFGKDLLPLVAAVVPGFVLMTTGDLIVIRSLSSARRAVAGSSAAVGWFYAGLILTMVGIALSVILQVFWAPYSPSGSGVSTSASLTLLVSFSYLMSLGVSPAVSLVGIQSSAVQTLDRAAASRPLI